MSLVALVLAATVTTAPDIPPVGTRAQAFIEREAGAKPELKGALEAYTRTATEMMEQKDNREALGILVRRLEQQNQCVKDLAGDKEAYRLTDGVMGQLIDRKQLMVDWLTAQDNLPPAVMNEHHEIKCVK